MIQAHLCLVLHAHLPFVRHPEYEESLEEKWLFEAITETYLPLLAMLSRLEQEEVDYRLTLSLSPTLMAMLRDALLQQRYLAYLDNLFELAAKEHVRHRWRPELRQLARMYQNRFEESREAFTQDFDCDLIEGFDRIARAGRLELITSAATHGYLPLIAAPEARRAQIEQGCRELERHIGRRPKGIWLPECGFTNGLDGQLRDAQLEYFFVETHGVLFANPRPRYGVYAPIRCPRSGLAAVGRDVDSGRQVWCATQGYPADPCYRDFHHDIGFELDYEYLRPHLRPQGIRNHTGIKYRRIASADQGKELYEPSVARARAQEHAGDFLARQQQRAEQLAKVMGDRPALIVAPYDAELFGHWWFEGPIWLESLLRAIAQSKTNVDTITISEYLERYEALPVSEPAASSWGAGGYHGVWLEAANDWIYPHLHEAEKLMIELAGRHPDARGLVRQALDQAARELMLAQSSDWPFIMANGTMVEYAADRVTEHILAFDELSGQIRRGQIDAHRLRQLESRHNLFPTIDYRLFA